jgi:hyperosmotically inducible protein
MHKCTMKFLAVPAFALTMAVASAAFAESAGQYIDDATITTRVKAAILANPQLKVSQVSVTTDHGAVQLSGTVDTKAQDSEAVRVTKEVDGVKSVMDKLTVRATQEQ